MAKTATRPKIEVQPVYLGNRDMREAFISLLVDEVRRGKSSPHTFEIIKDTEYMLSSTLGAPDLSDIRQIK